MNHYLLSCSVSANVRQSVQFKFDDLKLPNSVVETLEENGAVSLRPQLSTALKTELDLLRSMQRELYNECCIQFQDSHFVTETYFHDAMQYVKNIQRTAAEANERLASLWSVEQEKWESTTYQILRPLFADDEEFYLAKSAYMAVFPTKETYKHAIAVHVLGPLPVTLTKVTEPGQDATISEEIAYYNTLNTSKLLEAAKAASTDKAFTLSAELIDDLDVRMRPDRVNKQQTGSDKKRGSWEVTASRLKLIADSVPVFAHLATLADDLLETGRCLDSKDKRLREAATRKFFTLQDAVRQELTDIVNSSKVSTAGHEKLMDSLSMSTKYNQLRDKINSAESTNVLNLLSREVQLEESIYQQRSRELQKLLNKRKELIKASNENLDALISENQEVDF